MLMKLIKHFLVMCMCAFSVYTLAGQIELETWRDGNKIKTIVNHENKNLLISKNCIDPNDITNILKKCQNVLDQIKYSSKKSIYGKGGKNPGSIICKQFLNGKILFLKDIEQNIRTFCEVKENIVIDNLWIMKNYAKY